MEMNLFEVKYHLKSAQTNKWSTYWAKLIAQDIIDIQHWFESKWGHKNFEIVDHTHISTIHGVSPAVTDDIISTNINQYESILTEKIRDKNWQVKDLQTRVTRAKDDFYDIDSVINDGNERKKEQKADEIWGKKYA